MDGKLSEANTANTSNQRKSATAPSRLTRCPGPQYKANACASAFYSGPRQGTDPVPTPPSTPTPPSPPPPQLPMPPPPPSASSCASDSSWRDSDGDRCSHYDDKPEWCGFEDSQARCCACKTSASPPCATPVEDSSCARGVRVARGPHWRWGDQDGGVGGVGTVTGRRRKWLVYSDMGPRRLQRLPRWKFLHV